MREAWFIRHGESISNADLPTTHPATSELTAQGAAEAQQVVRAFTSPPDLIVISSFIRARQTAAPTLARFPQVSTATWPIHEFTYLAASHYNGTTGSERWPIAETYWQRNDPNYRDGTQSETFAEMVARVWDVIAHLRQSDAQFVALFSHGLFIRGLLWAILTNTTQPTPAQMDRYSHFCQAVRVPNGSICRLYFDETRLRLAGIDAAHMEQS